MLKALNGEEPYLDKSNRDPKKQAEFLRLNGNMKGKYLGACLDSCRWGGSMSVMWEMNVPEMVYFVQNWMRQNKKEFQSLWHEKKIEDMYTRFDLPYINHNVCPSNGEHNETILDNGGRTRCSHREIKIMKPSFIHESSSFDNHSLMEKLEIYDCKPYDPTPVEWEDDDGNLVDYSPEYEEFQKHLDEYESEEPINVTDTCYAIIREDKNKPLPLETILKRLNLRSNYEIAYCVNEFEPCKKINTLSKEDQELYKMLDHCPGHMQRTKKTEFPFDGWDLAFYVQKWYEQVPEGKSPVFERK